MLLCISWHWWGSLPWKYHSHLPKILAELLRAFQKRKQGLILPSGCHAPCQQYARSEQILWCEAINGHDSPESHITRFVGLEQRLYQMTGAKSAPQNHGSSFSHMQKLPACSPFFQHLAGWCMAWVTAIRTWGAGNLTVPWSETSPWQEFPTIKECFCKAIEF